MRRNRKGRGRPFKSTHSQEERSVLESLSLVAIKYDFDANDFFSCLVKAYNQDEFKNREVSISCRKKSENSAVFLFTRGEKVLGQFPIPTSLLKGTNPLESYLENFISKVSKIKESGMSFLKITDLRAGMKQVSVEAEVLEVPEPNTIYTRYGSQARVSNALIGDETGTIRMSLWNQQISMCSKGNKINIENGRIVKFRGANQLRLGKGGNINIIE